VDSPRARLGHGEAAFPVRVRTTGSRRLGSCTGASTN